MPPLFVCFVEEFAPPSVETGDESFEPSFPGLSVEPIQVRNLSPAEFQLPLLKWAFAFQPDHKEHVLNPAFNRTLSRGFPSSFF